MRFYTAIPKKLSVFFDAELEAYKIEYANGELKKAWIHLERAHILGQRYPLAHSWVHWEMIKFGLRIKSTKEVFGQIPRLFFGGVKSFVGHVPVGNPGGANVPPLKPFPISVDLLELFKKAGVDLV